MSALAPTLEAFFTERLIGQCQASPNTIAAYRDAWRLLLRFVRDRTTKEPSQLDLADLEAAVIGAFLEHLEHDRNNSVRTRNARLAAIRSFFRYAALRNPEHSALIARVLAIPAKRSQRAEVCYLTATEAESALAAPDRGTWAGRRDHALLDVALTTGLRVSELTGLRNQDVELRPGCLRTLLGEGAQGALHAVGEGHRSGAANLDARTGRGARRPRLPCPARHPAQPRRGRTRGRKALRGRRSAMPIAAHQARHTPRAAPFLRDGAPALGS
jgi:site-specific recombinase XerD